MTDPTPTLTLVIEREMPHPPEKIWRALTEGPLIEQWLMKNDFQPLADHRFTFRADWGSVDCQVLTIEPNKTLSYTWGAFSLDTVVTWTLTPTTGGTHVRMEQTGFRSETDANYKGATYGWRGFLSSLERVAGGLD
jgi:uncharacterized protein YndB with AHSA1/START domain